jgi:NAD(P) transhydrogenase subunit beta
VDKATIQNLAYLLASLMFYFGLKGLTHPRTAIRGNLTSALAMLLAVVVTLWATDIVSFTQILIGVIVGSAVGAVMAMTVPMTAMPEMVGLFNGFGGGASALVAGGALAVAATKAGQGQAAEPISTQLVVATAASGLIGAVTFWGSMVAVLKLQEKVKSVTLGGRRIWFSDSLLLPARHVITAAVAALTLLLCVLVVLNPTSIWLYWLLVVVASVLGVLITIPIGGADMPVVIALLNSYSGLAACATGFVINNTVLIIAGSLVGASGLILTSIMCKAMNRSLANVMFATMGPSATGPSADDVYAGKIKATTAEEVAMLFDGARRVVIVPGYGMAASQAQHAVRDLGNLLESRGVEVEYGIHPVAGRMPGHMNVLLAEADVPYEKLKEMDEINPTFKQTDVAIVVGANDVVNPVARTDPTSPIAGMPILDVDQARTVVVIKRSLSPGFAGIPNPLFALDNTLMFFSDGRKAFVDLIAAVKES